MHTINSQAYVMYIPVGVRHLRCMYNNIHYRFVLFKRHYDKYVALAEKYEESRGIAYYLEERYHEVKVRIRKCF